MSKNVLSEVEKIIREVLDNDDIILDHRTIASDVPDWDSMAHVRIMVAIEKHFKVRFDSEELETFENVGMLCEGVERHLA